MIFRSPSLRWSRCLSSLGFWLWGCITPGAKARWNGCEVIADFELRIADLSKGSLSGSLCLWERLRVRDEVEEKEAQTSPRLSLAQARTTEESKFRARPSRRPSPKGEGE